MAIECSASAESSGLSNCPGLVTCHRRRASLPGASETFDDDFGLQKDVFQAFECDLMYVASGTERQDGGKTSRTGGRVFEY